MNTYTLLISHDTKNECKYFVQGSLHRIYKFDIIQNLADHVGDFSSAFLYAVKVKEVHNWMKVLSIKKFYKNGKLK